LLRRIEFLPLFSVLIQDGKAFLTAHPERVTVSGQVEIVRSFSFKLNAELYGGNRFESRDFFCSQKASCDVAEADEIAILLHAFCKRVVLRDVRDYTRFVSTHESREVAAVDGISALTSNAHVSEVHALSFEEQERAILPSPKRKIVLATNIAETSLTIEGVKVVIDSGLTRRLQYDPASGMNRLITVAVSRAAGRIPEIDESVCRSAFRTPGCRAGSCSPSGWLRARTRRRTRRRRITPGRFRPFRR
jgi:hypothetical protein